jgi:hypothetical protein
MMKPLRHALSYSLPLLFLVGSAQAGLESSWRDVFSPTTGWELGCGYKMPAGQPINTCRSRAIVNFETPAGEPSDSDIIIHMMYDHRRLWPTLAPYGGECVSGVITGSNGLSIPLRGTPSGCVPDGGKVIARRGESNPTTLIPLEDFANNDQITVELTLKDGTKLSKTIDMSSFMGVFEEMESAGGGRGR